MSEQGLKAEVKRRAAIGRYRETSFLLSGGPCAGRHLRRARGSACCLIKVAWDARREISILGKNLKWRGNEETGKLAKHNLSERRGDGLAACQKNHQR